MTSFFPDLNVWFALSVEGHVHGRIAWQWMESLPSKHKLVFCRHTHLGLVRLLTNSAAMAKRVMNVADALEVYEAWAADPRVEFYQEPRDLSNAFRTAIQPFNKMPSSNAVADCYLMAFAKEANLVLVTLDEALKDVAKKHGYPAILLG
jgi:toxin-antitoxin system PIN domain toxin